MHFGHCQHHGRTPTGWTSCTHDAEYRVAQESLCGTRDFRYCPLHYILGFAKWATIGAVVKPAREIRLVHLPTNRRVA